MRYGYIRGSARQQDETRQKKAIEAEGVLKEKIYIENG